MTIAQATLSELIFSTFIFLCEDQRAIPAPDAQRLGKLIASSRWAKSATMRGGLGALRNRYVSLWLTYQSTAHSIDVTTIERQWRLVCDGLRDEEALQCIGDIRELTNRLCQGESKDQLARRDALRAIEDQLRAERSQSLKLLDKPLSQVKDVVSPAVKARPGDASGWWSGGEILLRCVAVIPEAPDVKTFIFAAVDGRRFQYNAGQAAIVHAALDGRTVKRSYTISSSPSRPDRLSFTIKRLEGGLVSSWFHQSMKVGCELMISGPHGRLTIADHPSDKLLLISAGSGITPMMSMLRYLHDIRADADVVFVNNVRTPHDIIYRQELSAISASLGRSLGLAIVPSIRADDVTWNGLIGRISELMLEAIVPDCATREVFCCGPDGYRSVVRAALQKLGHPANRYHEETFGISAKRAATTGMNAVRKNRDSAEFLDAQTQSSPSTIAAVADAMPVSPVEGTRRITFKKSGATVRCSEHETILDVAERSGIVLDSSCRVGACGACRIRKLDGSIAMDEQSTLDEHDVSAGYVLACSARITSDVVVDA